MSTWVDSVGVGGMNGCKNGDPGDDDVTAQPQADAILSAFDDGIAVEEEGEGAGEVEGPGEPPTGGDEEHPAAVGGELAEVRNRSLERRRVGGGAVADPAEVRQGRRVGPASGGRVLELLHPSSAFAALAATG
ncbi:hypothetical protein BHE74_00034718 [Ensete ventricosum]|nr:hypothetical protein BHE74_00034718 [Ensete ventricosum]